MVDEVCPVDNLVSFFSPPNPNGKVHRVLAEQEVGLAAELSRRNLAHFTLKKGGSDSGIIFTMGQPGTNLLAGYFLEIFPGDEYVWELSGQIKIDNKYKNLRTPGDTEVNRRKKACDLVVTALSGLTGIRQSDDPNGPFYPTEAWDDHSNSSLRAGVLFQRTGSPKKAHLMIFKGPNRNPLRGCIKILDPMNDPIPEPVVFL